MAEPNNVKSIFLAASEKPAAERAAFLDEATGGDTALRVRVEALLKAHDNPDSFLNEAAAKFGATVDLSPAEQPLAEQPGTLIGPYKLLEQIGEGGMGVVYMADQQAPVRRRVALKIIKAGMDTRQVIARFEAERQALALMDHSNIARVLDAGATESGRPYFVMELVRGVPITAYCDQNNLPVHERLELFVQVCHAVQHAHQKGIIHRDLKPTNVLVTLNDGRAVPKVIDFGVAKATGQQLTEKTLFTAFAQMVGTPLYMSPEQAEMTSLDIDTRSDIYSLGVLLYELLTGTTPFDQQRMRAAAFDEIRRIIREEEPPKPSTRISTLGESRTATAAHRQLDAHRLGRLMEGDLDWIVMKALEKDRTQRYDTAGNFAADVLRHLSDQPVEACPPSAADRFRKFARRNRIALTTVALVSGALMLGTVVSTWQAVRATLASRDKEAALVREANLRHEAEARGKIVRAQLLCDTSEFEQAEKLMSDVPDEFIQLEAKSSALIFAALANWNGGENRWNNSAAHYDALLFGRVELGLDPNPDVLTMYYLCYAADLAELGDDARYEKVRESAIRKFGISQRIEATERMLTACLLLPANERQFITLDKWADRLAAAKTGDKSEYRCWGWGALALFEHRHGNQVQALDYGKKCLESQPSPACRERAHIIMAMSYIRRDQFAEGRAELAECRETVESKFRGKLGVGTYDSGLWKDWLIDHALLREADRLLAKSSAAPQP